MIPEARDVLADMAAQAVRSASRELRLVTRDEVLEEVCAILADIAPEGEAHATAAPPVAPLPETAAGLEGLAALDRQELSALLGAVLAAHPGLAVLQGVSGQTLHHAPDLLSRTYARILDRKGSPLLLVAGEIRANSRDYPRPVPVELFKRPPFDLTPEDIAQALAAMAASPEYQDIGSVTTGTGAVHLFSTRHLERGYALFLAQRSESLEMNP